MPRAFTYYWTNRTWERCRALYDGDPLDHVASSRFRQSGVAKGDRIYVFTISRGKLYLCGRLQVDELLDREEAIEYLASEDVPHKPDHCVCRPAQGTPMLFDRLVPFSIVRALRFESALGPRPLVLKTASQLDPQTMRGVRRLTPASARLLDDLLSR